MVLAPLPEKRPSLPGRENTTQRRTLPQSIGALGFLYGYCQKSIQSNIKRPLPLGHITPGMRIIHSSPVGQCATHAIELFRGLPQPLGNEPMQLQAASIKQCMRTLHGSTS
jgi:hypothetical protein